MLNRSHQLMAGVVILATMLYSCAIEAQQPKLDMHRAGVSADDGSGWHSAVSTKGGFAVRLPIPFNDFSVHSTNTGEVSHVIGGKSSEGIKFSAVESPVTPKTPVDLGEIPKSFCFRRTQQGVGTQPQHQGWRGNSVLLGEQLGIDGLLQVHQDENGLLHADNRKSQCLS